MRAGRADTVTQRRWCLLLGAVVALLAPGALAAGARHDWPVYGGDAASSKYSPLAQINRDNVKTLVPAWTYHSAHGAPLHATSEVQVNPIVVDGVLYGRNPHHNVFAVDAVSGRERWTFDPFARRTPMLGAYMRGVTYWASGNDKRILVTAAHELIALDARSGKPIATFGDNGRVDLRHGLGRDAEKIALSVPTPGVIYRDLLIVGSATTEAEGAAPGHVRAFDVRSGRQVWMFHTIPQPGEFGYDSWPPQAWKTAGGANAWAGMSVDPQRGVVYVPTGSPTPDFNGSQRHGQNLFGNSVIALDAASGRRRWHYQTVHHDLWDRDLSSAPTLVTLQRNGKPVDALIQASKQGVLFVLERDSGKPVFPIDEVPVPASDVPGEQAWPTQPHVTLPEPLVRQHLTADELTTLTPQAHAYVRKLFADSQPFAYFRPPGLQPTLIYPGFYGGMNWGGGAFDAGRQTYFINAIDAPHRVQMLPMQVPAQADVDQFGAYLYQKNCSGCHGSARQGFYPFAPALTGVAQRLDQAGVLQVIANGRGRMNGFANLSAHERDALAHYLLRADDIAPAATTGADATRTDYVFGGYNDFVDEEGYPAVKPPWGTLNAVDMRTGKRRWQVPLGEDATLMKKGITATGTRNFGGPIVTAGGLLFIGATPDALLRAFDVDNGRELWRHPLPAAAYSTPSTYMIDGVQYVVVSCGGGKLGTPSGDAYVAFRLPQ